MKTINEIREMSRKLTAMTAEDESTNKSVSLAMVIALEWAIDRGQIDPAQYLDMWRRRFSLLGGPES